MSSAGRGFWKSDDPPLPKPRDGLLYISYDGMLEPLGQSQVIAYLERLTDLARIHIVSFEKPADRRRPERSWRYESGSTRRAYNGTRLPITRRPRYQRPCSTSYAAY